MPVEFWTQPKRVIGRGPIGSAVVIRNHAVVGVGGDLVKRDSDDIGVNVGWDAEKKELRFVLDGKNGTVFHLKRHKGARAFVIHIRTLLLAWGLGGVRGYFPARREGDAIIATLPPPNRNDRGVEQSG